MILKMFQHIHHDSISPPQVTRQPEGVEMSSCSGVVYTWTALRLLLGLKINFLCFA